MPNTEEKSIFTIRPPIVAVLGHVDHGKTTLLDYIRKTKFAAKEAGGITQKIGAYQVEVKSDSGTLGKITFIDTPGHQAFFRMRSRGASVADIVVLVVAADDGVMPQTLESIEHIKKADVPFLVALTKVDLPTAGIERVKKQLADNGIFVEGYGGDTVCIPVSAKTGEGIKELLEMLLLLSQIHELEADPGGGLDGVVVESRKDQVGSTGTVIVRSGTLRVADTIKIEDSIIKVRGLINENGDGIKEAGPSMPVEVLGFDNPPTVGARITRADKNILSKGKVEVINFSQLTKEDEGKLKIILRADTEGSLEALLTGLTESVVVFSAKAGDILESDVLLAKSIGAKIFGFRVKAPQSVMKLAESEKVEIRTYEIIYQFFEDLDKELLAMIEPAPKEEIIGKAEIVAEFILAGSRIAGCRVMEGRVNKETKVRLMRGGKTLGGTLILSMKQRAKDISEAKIKEVFGAVLNPPLDFKVGDMLVSFRPILNE